MRLTTTPHELDAHFGGVTADRGPGIFARAYARLVAAQERRARRVVSVYLARGTDEDLARLGYRPSEIARLRDTATRTPVKLL